MDAGAPRSTGVNETLVAPAREAPSEAAAAFEALYRSSRDDVFAYVCGLLRDRSAAEDVTAQAFERAYRRRATFNPKLGSHRAWLFGIARNAALDELRRRSRHAELVTEPEDAEAPTGDESAEAAVRRTAIRNAMAGLSARERELVALKFFAGLQNTEIARVIGTSESNAGTRLHRVLEKLRRACDEA
ncbi:MAG TPA: sigma-70 family RNA polymerase sigma factor [Solirubrobacterales bacterium]|nr:sigma-70 family RNA polymerase sigma factor [Solirubrobacterales bacterium]